MNGLFIRGFFRWDDLVFGVFDEKIWFFVVKDNDDNVLKYWEIWFLLIFWGEKIGNLILICGGSFWNLVILDLYVVIRYILFDFSNFLILVIFWVILNIVCDILFFFLFKIVRCLKFILFRLDLSNLIVLLILFCIVFLCLIRVVVIFWKCLIIFVFWIRMLDIVFRYFGWIYFLSFCKFFFKMFFLFLKVFFMLINVWFLCFLEEEYCI